MLKRYLTVLLLLTIISGPSLAAEGAETATTERQLFGQAIGKVKAHACFRRTYDAVHLSRHPQQNVRTMLLLVTGVPGEGPGVPAATTQLVLNVSFRGENTHFETVGDCRSLAAGGVGGATAPSTHCGIDCDGGSIDVSLKGPDTVLVGIPERARIWRAGTDPEDETGPYRKRFGADDKLFRLERTALVDCVALVSDATEKAALRRGR